jgi:hypothetical protein
MAARKSDCLIERDCGRHDEHTRTSNRLRRLGIACRATSPTDRHRSIFPGDPNRDTTTARFRFAIGLFAIQTQTPWRDKLTGCRLRADPSYCSADAACQDRADQPAGPGQPFASHSPDKPHWSGVVLETTSPDSHSRDPVAARGGSTLPRWTRVTGTIGVARHSGLALAGGLATLASDSVGPSGTAPPTLPCACLELSRFKEALSLCCQRATLGGS